MERFNALGRGAQLMLVGGVLLFIDLFLTWQNSEEVLGIDVPVSFKGWEGIGLLLGILTIILLAWLIVRLASVDIPLPVSTAMTGALLGTLIAIFAVIKLLTILGNDTTIWAWIGVALAVVIVVGAFMTVQEAGGVDQLRQEASSLGASTGGGAATSPPEAPAPAPAPAAPEASPAAPEASAALEAPAPTAETAADTASDAAADAEEAASDSTGDDASPDRPT